jgi:hypothetical protein
MELDRKWIDSYYAASPDVRVAMREEALAEGVPSIGLSALDLFVSFDERLSALEKQIEALQGEAMRNRSYG